MKLIALFLLSLAILSAPALATEALSISWAIGDATVRPGGQTTIDLTISNPSLTGSIQYVRLSFLGGQYLTVSPDYADIASIGTLANQHTVLDVRVAGNAVSTTSYITVKATYSVSNLAQETTIKIPIKIRRDPIFQIQNVNFTRQPEPGISTTLTFDIFNSGEGSAKDMTITLGNSSVFSSVGSGESYTASLRPSEMKNVSFPVSISSSASPGVYSVPVVFSYYDESSNDLTTEQKNLGLEVNGKVQFIITVEELTNFYFGKQGTASISISNAGRVPAEFMILNATSKFGNKELYIGELESDDTEVVDIAQDLSRASGKYPLNLSLTWNDKFGNVYEETKTIELTPHYAPVSGSVVTLFILIIAGFVGYRFYKKKKK